MIHRKKSLKSSLTIIFYSNSVNISAGSGAQVVSGFFLIPLPVNALCMVHCVWNSLCSEWCIKKNKKLTDGNESMLLLA